MTVKTRGIDSKAKPGEDEEDVITEWTTNPAELGTSQKVKDIPWTEKNEQKRREDLVET